jgi:hypothetical protein
MVKRRFGSGDDDLVGWADGAGDWRSKIDGATKVAEGFEGGSFKE